MQLPEVQDLIRKLSLYGLGVCVPHMHREGSNEMLPLPRNMVQTETHLHISFCERDKVDPRQVPVAWQWDDDLRTIQCCSSCQPPDGPHH